MQSRSLGYSRHYRLLKELEIAYPARPEQQRIVGILDKATDIVMMKKSLGTFSEVERNSTKMKKALGSCGSKFVEAYSKSGGMKAVVRMVSEIEKRARYMERG